MTTDDARNALAAYISLTTADESVKVQARAALDQLTRATAEGRREGILEALAAVSNERVAGWDGSPPDPDSEYIWAISDAEVAVRALTERPAPQEP